MALVSGEDEAERRAEVGQVAWVNAAGVELGGKFAQELGPVAVARELGVLDRHMHHTFDDLNGGAA